MIHSIFRGFRLAIVRIIRVRMNGKSSLLYQMREAVRDTASGFKDKTELRWVGRRGQGIVLERKMYGSVCQLVPAEKETGEWRRTCR